jgi:cell division protein FtsI/penicillin-binding protein 2
VNEQKRNRIVAAFTVNAVLLIVIIFAVIIYQIVEISILSTRKKELTEEYNRLSQQYEQSVDDLEKLNLEDQLYILAIQLGYTPKK